MEKMARLSKIIQRKDNNTLELAEPRDSPDLLVANLMDEHFPGNIPCVHQNSRNKRRPLAYIPYIDQEKVTVAFKSFQNYKAPGPDTIPPIAYKHLNRAMLYRIVQCYKACLTLGYTPEVWRKANAIFIPKPGKDNYSNIRSFRPITLSNFILKGLERVVMWHLEETVLQSNPLNANQHAFRKGHSTESALTGMVDKLEYAINNNKFAIGVFLDIKGAFDNVDAESVIRGMQAKGFDCEVTNWYGNLLQNRSVTVDYKGCKLERKLTRGTPQGGVLSPLMWNLVFDSLLDLYKDGPVQSYGYADDGSLVMVGNDLPTMQRCMQRAVDKAVEWGNVNGLTFSEDKTVAVIFTNKYKYSYPLDIVINGRSIPYSKEVRYLGVQLDHRLTWKQHIKLKVRQAKAQILRIKNAMGKLWGAPPKMIRWAFTGIVRPALTYGALVWARAAESKWAQKEFTKVNRLALLAMGHFRKSTPTAGMEILNDIRPIKYQLQYEATQGYLRTKPFHKGVKTSAHLIYASKLLRDQLVLSDNTDEGTTTFNWGKTFRIDEQSFDKGEPDTCKDITVYTDGSLIQEHAGSGFYYCGTDGSEEHSFHLGRDRSVFQAEIYAVKKVTEHLLERSTTDKTIVYHIDSQAAIKALESPKVNKHCVRETITALNLLGHQNIITIRWIKSHIGHEGNTIVDELAKQGARDLTRSPMLDRPLISKTVIRNGIRDLVDKLWDEEWVNVHPCRQTKLFFPKSDRVKAKSIVKLNRKEHSIAIQFFTGHGFLNRHSALVDPSLDPRCSCANDDQTAHHIIAECPLYARARRMIFGTHILETFTPWTVPQVMQFLRDTQLCDRDRDETR
jgi:ribonuclease HI